MLRGMKALDFKESKRARTNEESSQGLVKCTPFHSEKYNRQSSEGR